MNMQDETDIIHENIILLLNKWSETCIFWQDNLMERFNEEIIDSLKNKTTFFLKSFDSLIYMVNSCKSEIEQMESTFLHHENL